MTKAIDLAVGRACVLAVLAVLALGVWLGIAVSVAANGTPERIVEGGTWGGLIADGFAALLP